ncbi:hypothetical protein DAPPUDRAFT_119445 [Daphnia pulex]|uniref:Uncharacterized protein n=1 Tax=Daphnia pulex TaxID=6669 RepID=E9HYJ4_DAPPU|nr:hypothetical protein DAPPUDRAFT_119445 [Daphnia pulex]|eukprot:EFX63186.1 hypothetical protein DAPPUDRAFT_119445 [Daphnia pulex]
MNRKCAIPYFVYKTLDEMGFPVSIKDISAISGLSENDIYSMQESEKTFCLNASTLLEKYCRGFGSIFGAILRGLKPIAKLGLNAGKRFLKSDLAKNLATTALDMGKTAATNIAVDLLEEKKMERSIALMKNVQ